ncbi:PREDICTED: transient-receptor-potential-like protein isoform X2 [Nicrophorus vespilloides]|uniref:Transient-receptor-potential-like protein isoform X2 n=1 Tax=Nicrophorus vespilloides TaxID=110193 RepID=A0ABM1NCC7_NICVS|nr:PREDICTED: transient-receptor-potential-like protein isoform X2 [Nicrophorus vespilloides]
MDDVDNDSLHVKVDVISTNNQCKMPILPKSLSLEEKKYLLAVERGDLANVKRMLQLAQRYNVFNVNCMDSLGRTALTLAIDGENLEMVELLVIMGIETKDALLHAINVEFVEAVELLLEHEEIIHEENEPYSWQKVDVNIATFTPDITPLVLAAHRNNYEILKILLDRGANLPMPHDIKCGCDDCIKNTKEDSLRHSLSRMNEYKALASPSLIALSSTDPILTSFQLSWELKNLAFAEPECKSEYMELRMQCQQFAVDLLQQSRSSSELAIILNHDPYDLNQKDGDEMQLTRLKLAIEFKQKKFVAHSNIQQLVTAIWYEGLPGFRRRSTLARILIICKVALLFPYYCLMYIVAPRTASGRMMRKPFMKFLIHASSYLFFLFVLILVSQRAEEHMLEYFKLKQPEEFRPQRGNPPSILEYILIIFVLGFICEEINEIYVKGIRAYHRNLWNVIDCGRNILYFLVFALRVVAYVQQREEISRDPQMAYIRREDWHDYDLQLIAEGLFAAANILSALKLVHLFSINPHLGPLQISLGRMIIDIVKFFFIYTLVLFSFACGLNQLLWYFSDLEHKKCYNGGTQPDLEKNAEACSKWRRFANVFETSQSLFWASFGMIDIENFELTGIKSYTRFWGLLMFGSYSVINIIVLLNLLIAMMSNSYAIIDCHSDTEWKFARTKLLMNYFDQTQTLPPPFNILPTPKFFLKLCGLHQRSKMRKSQRSQKQEKDRDYRYTLVMRALVWRYVTSMHRKCEENAVTEDDINEVKNDISAFRYEMLEILNRNGMDVSSAEKKEKVIAGKKMKIWERRLMKDFKVVPVNTKERIVSEDGGTLSGNEDSLTSSQIGRCNSKQDSKKQRNLQQAMNEAKRIAESEEEPIDTPNIKLPDVTGDNLLGLIGSENDQHLTPRVIVHNELNGNEVEGENAIRLLEDSENGNTAGWI